MRLSDTADSFVFIRKAYDVSMTYALASNAKAMTAIRTLLAVMVFSGTSYSNLEAFIGYIVQAHQSKIYALETCGFDPMSVL